MGSNARLVGRGILCGSDAVRGLISALLGEATVVTSRCDARPKSCSIQSSNSGKATQDTCQEGLHTRRMAAAMKPAWGF